MRTFLAVAKREWTIFFRYPSWVVALLVWPVLAPSLAVFTARALAGPSGSGLAVFTQHAGTSDYAGFIMTGMILWMWLNMVLWVVGGSLRAEQQRGTLESNWMTPANRLAIVFGSGLTGTATTALTVVVGVVLFRVLWGVRVIPSPLLALVFLLSTVAIYGLGLVFSSMVLLLKQLNAMVFFVRGVFLVFCGMSYPLSVLPAWMRSVSRFLPLTYSIDLTRRVGLAGAGLAEVRSDLAILAVFALGLFAAGCLAFLSVDRTVRRNGTLGQY
ncbi:MAG: ABC transporter permease [Firmicutes bacterium]|jgi:ABC-2 type transport system permease protein|nr:ABC transporter permease [Bacillota bacterium]